MMKKRMIAVVMMVVMLLSTFSMTAFAADVPACGDLYTLMAVDDEQVQIILRASGELTECQYTLEFSCDLQDVENNVTAAFSKDFTSFVSQNKGQKACGIAADSASKVTFGVIFADPVSFEEGEVGTVTIKNEALPAGQTVSITVYNGSEKVSELVIQNDILYGDVDGNEKIEAADALMILKNVVKLTTLTAEQEKVADVDNNEKIEAADALLVLKKVVNLIDKFPAEQ